MPRLFDTRNYFKPDFEDKLNKINDLILENDGAESNELHEELQKLPCSFNDWAQEQDTTHLYQPLFQPYQVYARGEYDKYKHNLKNDIPTEIHQEMEERQTLIDGQPKINYYS